MSLDSALLQWINSFAHHSFTFDTIVFGIVNNQLIKGSVLVLFCWAWFQNEAGQDLRRTYLITGLCSPFVAFIVARICADILPFRLRPLMSASLHLRVPYGVDIGARTFVRTWSSFPSDHAACFSAISVALLLVSRSAGVLAFLFTVLVIDLPRLYLGYHYPSDILGGTIVGALVALVLTARPVRSMVGAPVLRLSLKRPGAFYAGMFFALFTLGSIDSVNALVRFGVQTFAKSIHWTEPFSRHAQNTPIAE